MTNHEVDQYIRSADYEESLRLYDILRIHLSEFNQMYNCRDLYLKAASHYVNILQRENEQARLNN